VHPLVRQALLDEFNIEAEDDSPAQIARLLCVMHAEVRRRAQAAPVRVLLSSLVPAVGSCRQLGRPRLALTSCPGRRHVQAARRLRSLCW
jgi:hypothetical protein